MTPEVESVLLVGDETSQTRRIRFRRDGGSSKTALPLGGLLGENVAVVRPADLDLSAGGLAEALCCASMALHLRHLTVPGALR